MMSAATCLSETCRLYIAVLFFSAAGSKLFARREFERTITEAVRIPALPGHYLAVTTITAEGVAASFSSMTGIWAQVGVSLALFLSLVFTGFLATMLFQGRAIRCSCFGQSRDILTPLDLFRNAFLIGACAIYLLRPAPEEMFSFNAYLQLTAMAVIAFLISVNLKEISAILRME